MSPAILPGQTGISYSDVIALTTDQVLEHTPHDTDKSEFFMARPVIANPAQKLGTGIWNPTEEIEAAGVEK